MSGIGQKKGYKQTPSHIMKVSSANRGKKRTEEQRKKISAGLKDHIPWNKGKVGIYSERTLKLMSENRKNKGKGIVPWNKGKLHSLETREKMASSHTGKKRPKVVMDKFREGLFRYIEKNGGPFEGKHHSTETKLKISNSNKNKVVWNDGKTWEEMYGVDRAKTMKKRLSKNSSGENHYNWKNGAFPNGYNWNEQRTKTLKLYSHKSAISGECKTLHIHHIIHRSEYLNFIFDIGYNKYLKRILFPFFVPELLVDEMNKLENLIPLTRSEHGKYESKPKRFFDKYKKEL